MRRVAIVCKVDLLYFVLHAGSLLFCGSDTITRISFTGQTSEKSFSHPILSIDTLNDSIALLLSNGEVVFLSGSDLRETSRVTVPCVTESSLCTLLWGEASHLLLGVASASLHLFLLSPQSATELAPLCTPDTGRSFSSRWSLGFDAALGLFVASHAASSELCLVSRARGEWRLLSAGDGENVCVPLDEGFEPLAVERVAVVREGGKSFLFFATEGEDAAAGIRRVCGEEEEMNDDDIHSDDDDDGCNDGCNDGDEEEMNDDIHSDDGDDGCNDGDDDGDDDDMNDDGCNDGDDGCNDGDVGCNDDDDDDMNDDGCNDGDDGCNDGDDGCNDDDDDDMNDDGCNDMNDEDSNNNNTNNDDNDDDMDSQHTNDHDDIMMDTTMNDLSITEKENSNDISPDETPIPIDKEYQTLLPPPLSLPAAIPALRELQRHILRHRDHRKQLESLPREPQLPPSQRILRAIEEETAVLTQLKEAKRSLRDYLAKSAESIRLGSQHPHSLRWDLLARGFLGTDVCAILAPSAPETNVVVESLDRFFSEKPSSLHVSFASLKSRTIASMAQEWRSDSGKRVSERCREEVFEVLLREEREREREREVAAAKEAARAKEEERKRQAEETLLKEKERKEKERREKEKEEKERKGKKEMPATTNPLAATQSSGVSGTKENGMVEKPGVSQPAKNTVNNGPFNAVTQTSGNFGKKTEGNGGLFGKAGEAQNGGLFGKPAANGGVFNKPAGNTENPFNQPAGNGGLFSKPAESAGKGGLFGQTTETNGGLFGKPAANGGMFNKPAENNGGLFGKPAENQNGGLFGKPAENQIGGLFGKPAESGSGMFNKPAEPNAGLFSKPAASGGLFSSQGGFTSQQSQGGLFGGGQQSAFGAPKGGLFASQAKQVNPVAVLMSCHIG